MAQLQQKKEKKKANSSFLAFCILFKPSKNWGTSTCIGEGDLLYSVYPLSCECLLGTLLGTPRNKV